VEHARRSRRLDPIVSPCVACNVQPSIDPIVSAHLDRKAIGDRAADLVDALGVGLGPLQEAARAADDLSGRIKQKKSV